MSTITVTNIQATGETASRAVSGVAAAWVNFNGTGTIAIRDSQNVSGLVDNGTGQYSATYTNNLANANYCPSLAGGGLFSGSGAQGYANLGGTPDVQTSSTIKVCTVRTDSDATRDAATICAAIHGDLA